MKVYTSLVPQMDEYGSDTGLWMLSHELGNCVNLGLGWCMDAPHTLMVCQVEEFYESERDESGYIPDEHVKFIGLMACDGLTEDEWHEKLAHFLDEHEEVWWL